MKCSVWRSSSWTTLFNVLISTSDAAPLRLRLARRVPRDAAQRIYEELALVALIDMDTGVVHNVECTMVTGLAKEFVSNLIIGYDMKRGIDDLVARMERQYQGHLKKALVSAIKMVGTQYAEMVRSETKA